MSKGYLFKYKYFEKFVHSHGGRTPAFLYAASDTEIGEPDIPRNGELYHRKKKDDKGYV